MSQTVKDMKGFSTIVNNNDFENFKLDIVQDKMIEKKKTIKERIIKLFK